ncbi:MAG: hypothetical protein ACI909_001205 [Planctomycetota bacterium]|jgi:hypothetical protein
MKSAKSYYFVNAAVDFFFIGGSSFLLFFLFLFFYTDIRTPEVIALGIYLSWIINWPHFSMSTYRLYQSKSNMRQYPVTSYLIPFVVLGGVALSFGFPSLVAPYFVKLFLLWSPYHFSGQTIGITVIYAMRCGIKLSRLDRRILAFFVFGTYFVSMIRAEVSRQGNSFYGVDYPSIAVPQWMATISEYAMWTALVLFVSALLFWCYRNKKIIPVIVLLPAATQYLWFVQSIYMPSFQEFVPLLHSLQYILVAWGLQLKEKLDVQGIAPSKHYVMTETTRWVIINFIGGAILFYLLPFTGVVLGYSHLFSIAIFFSAIQIHHFFVDGVIWKLKNETVSHPLMMNVRDISGGRGKGLSEKALA